MGITDAKAYIQQAESRRRSADCYSNQHEQDDFMTMFTEPSWEDRYDDWKASWEDAYDELQYMTGRYWRVWKKDVGE